MYTKHFLKDSLYWSQAAYRPGKLLQFLGVKEAPDVEHESDKRYPA